MKYLTLSITFLDGTYHGMVDAGREEWPPSPMRVYQALVATAGRLYGPLIPDAVSASLQWLSELPPPVIDAPLHRRAMPVRSSVPNNAMDICARAWSRGSYDAKDAKMSTHKAMKTIAPVRLLVDDPLNAPVRYRWAVSDSSETAGHCEVIVSLARQLVCVGWGLDLVAGHGELKADELGEDGASNRGTETNSIRWTSGQGSTRLRLPNAHTLPALQKKHDRFVKRLADGTLSAVPALPPSAYHTVTFGTPWEAKTLPVAAFSLIEVDGSRFVRFATRKGSELVGMVRSAIASAARNAGWHEKKVASVVLGHGEPRGQKHESVGLERFAYVPLPSLERRSDGGPANHVGLIRRLLIYCPSGGLATELDWARRALAGMLLHEEKSKQPVAMLSTIPESDSMVKRYTGTRNRTQSTQSSTWSTVTPMVLPRNYMSRQDHQRLKRATDAETKRELYKAREDRIEQTIRLAIVQAGFSEVLAQNAAIDWRRVGYWPGSPKSDQFFVPDHLRKFPCLHVRITWRDPAGNSLAQPGPFVIGGGRFFGLGLFALES